MTPKQARQILRDHARWEKYFAKYMSLYVAKLPNDRYMCVSLN